MRKTTVARGSYLLRLRVQTDGAWVGQVEDLSSGRKAIFATQEQMVERIAALLGGEAAASPLPGPDTGQRVVEKDRDP